MQPVRAPSERTPWKAACRRLYAHDAFRHLRVRSARRLLVVTFAIVLAGFPALGWLSGATWPVLLTLIPYTVGAVLLSVATQGVFDRPVRHLDERQAHVRRNIISEPYVTGVSLGLAGGLLMAAATRADEGLMMGALLAVIGTIYFLPTMKLAWTMSDEADDEA